ncbi:MAG TPA: formyl transferase [Saprospiraceae bacterium]|nr:formyl transferase [Saprospiraceae bacterium]
MQSNKIVLLAGKGISTNIVYNFLKDSFDIARVIIEEPPSRISLIKKRIKRFGILKVTGQLAFQVIIMNALKMLSKKRKQEILDNYLLDDTPPPADKVNIVRSVNDKETISLLNELHPTLVIVNGTRIISKQVLNSVNATFINTHAGITPKYRNVHGAYWALVKKDPEHCGVTVHLVDQGIDTGKVLYQKTITVSEKDNFVTYPFLQIGEGVRILRQAASDHFNDRLTIKDGTRESHLWYHPTIFQYLYYRFKFGVK